MQSTAWLDTSRNLGPQPPNYYYMSGGLPVHAPINPSIPHLYSAYYSGEIYFKQETISLLKHKMNDLNKANEEALKSINAIISGQNIDLNNQQKSYLQRLISGIEMNKELFELQSMRWGPVVQVKTTVTFAARPHSKEVKVKLDVDIPPENSQQQPHIGYEVKWNDKRVGNGHIWISPNLLNASRPGFQQKLEKYGFTSPWLEGEDRNPEYVKANITKVKVDFKRWRGS